MVDLRLVGQRTQLIARNFGTGSPCFNMALCTGGGTLLDTVSWGNRIDIDKLQKLDQSITNNYDLETEFSFCHIVCTLTVNTNIFSPLCQSWALWISLSSAPAPADSVWSLLLVQLLATAGGRSLDKWLMDPTSKDFFFSLSLLPVLTALYSH